jgi:hypothetical protein
MNPLQRSSLGIEIDEILATRDTGPSLFAGHDTSGRQYLAVQARRDERSSTWLCAPISQLALYCVREGRAAPIDAMRHSATGIVHRITVSIDDPASDTESIQLCRELGDDDLAGADSARVPRWLEGARCA